MLVIAITGGIGSGKSEVSRLFRQHNIPSVSADDIVREITAPEGEAYHPICNHFGQNRVLKSGALDRSALRQMIFSDSEQRKWLEQLLHPIILRRIQEKIATWQAAYCVVEIPLLAETTRPDWVDRVLVVDAPRSLQIKRVKERDSLNDSEIEAILSTQSSSGQRLTLADDVIDNKGSVVDLAFKVNELHHYYLELSK